MFGRIVFIVVLLLVSSINGRVTKNGAACDGHEPYNPTPGGELEYEENDTEWTNVEPVYEDAQLRLNFCKVENFCTIEWYNDVTGEPILSEDGYIRFENDNQVLVLEHARLTDGGYYTCKPSQGSWSLQPRTALVQVIEVNSGGLAALTHEDCKDKEAYLGESPSFYCEYVVGTSRPPGFISPSTLWYKENGTSGEFIQYRDFEDLEDDPEVTTNYEQIVNTKYVERKGPGDSTLYVFNTTLHLWNTSSEAFGHYQVKYGFGSEVWYGNLTLIEKLKPPVDRLHGLVPVVGAVGAFLILLSILGTICFVKQLDIKLYWKDHFSKDCKNDKKESDAYISYSHDGEEDLNFVIHVLQEQLQSQGYRVIIRDIHHTPGTPVVEEIVKSLDTCRRCILVISPAYMRSWMGNYDIQVMMDQVQSCKRQIVPIIFRETSLDSSSETSDKNLLKHILEHVPCVRWPEQRSEVKTESHTTESQSKSQVKKMDKKKMTFQKELMLRMPPRYLLKQSHSYNTTMSQVDIISHEEKRGSITPSTSFPNGFAPIYPSPNPEFSSNSTNMATVPATSHTGINGGPKSSGPAKLYPVLT